MVKAFELAVVAVPAHVRHIYRDTVSSASHVARKGIPYLKYAPL